LAEKVALPFRLTVPEYRKELVVGREPSNV
jgi:hypothetical protein